MAYKTNNSYQRPGKKTSYYNSKKKKSHNSAGKNPYKKYAKNNGNNLVGNFRNTSVLTLVDLFFILAIIVGLIVIVFNFDAVIYGLFVGFLFPLIKIISRIFVFLVVVLVVYFIIKSHFRRRW